MTSRTDDKAVHTPRGQDPEKPRDNVVLLVPKSWAKAAGSAVRPPVPDPSADQPVRDGDDDDPGPTAA
jgi:hypothetical protein